MDKKSTYKLSSADTETDEETAGRFLEQAGGEVKTAILMQKRGVGAGVIRPQALTLVCGIWAQSDP